MPDDDVEARVTSLEREVARRREQITLTSSDATAACADAVAARVLAAGADRDVSEARTDLRAHIQALNAVRETQLEQGREIREGFASQTRRIDELEREVRSGFTTLATGIAQITALLTEIRARRLAEQQLSLRRFRTHRIHVSRWSSIRWCFSRMIRISSTMRGRRSPFCS